MKSPKSFFIFLLTIIMLNSCATESKLLKQLETNPNDSQTISKLARHYYKQQKYYKAYTFYKKLEKSKQINDSQRYFMYISRSRLSQTPEKGWEVLYPLRNSSRVQYKKFIHSTGLTFTIPEHWIGLSQKSKPDVDIIDNLDLSHNYYLTPRIKMTKRRISSLDNEKGFIYCAPGFIIEYEIKLPKESGDVSHNVYDDIETGHTIENDDQPVSPGESPETMPEMEWDIMYTYYAFYGLKKQIHPLIKNLIELKDKGQIINPECFIFQREPAEDGKRTVLKKKKYTSNIKIDDSKQNIYLITYSLKSGSAMTAAKIEKFLQLFSSRKKKIKKVKIESKDTTKPASEQDNQIRIVNIVMIGRDGNAELNITTHFEEKHSNVYLQEIDTFLSGITLFGF